MTEVQGNIYVSNMYTCPHASHSYMLWMFLLKPQSTEFLRRASVIYVSLGHILNLFLNL